MNLLIFVLIYRWVFLFIDVKNCKEKKIPLFSSSHSLRLHLQIACYLTNCPKPTYVQFTRQWKATNPLAWQTLFAWITVLKVVADFLPSANWLNVFAQLESWLKWKAEISQVFDELWGKIRYKHAYLELMRPGLCPIWSCTDVSSWCHWQIFNGCTHWAHPPLCKWAFFLLQTCSSPQPQYWPQRGSREEGRDSTHSPGLHAPPPFLPSSLLSWQWKNAQNRAGGGREGRGRWQSGWREKGRKSFGENCWIKNKRKTDIDAERDDKIRTLWRKGWQDRHVV